MSTCNAFQTFLGLYSLLKHNLHFYKTFSEQEGTLSTYKADVVLYTKSKFNLTRIFTTGYLTNSFMCIFYIKTGMVSMDRVRMYMTPHYLVDTQALQPTRVE